MWQAVPPELPPPSCKPQIITVFITLACDACRFHGFPEPGKLSQLSEPLALTFSSH